ncbi:MAG: TolC family protein [Planctomycetes bacterium]|nr:TolC family protein [Planctomycetota bacterium]
MSGQSELQLPQLMEQVLARNPSLWVTTAAWRAAAQRYPQVISLDDPMFGLMLGPGSWGSDEVNSAYTLEASQKLPWPGKRQLRGDVALAEASAARFDIGDTRLRLVEAAKLSFFDYYLVERELEVNDRNTQIVQEFRDTADAKYRANQVTQQDVLQADVDLAELRRRRFELERSRVVAIARINTLLHRQADYPLPDPPASLPPTDEAPPADLLQQLAIGRRPDLAAIDARIRAEQANVALAAREFYPDVELVGRYDAFWQEEPLRPMVGMNVNVPIQRERRRAAVREAMFRANQRRAEFEQQIDTIRNDVQAAYARVVESRRVTELYRQTLLPVAEQNVESARAGYVAARVDFLRLIEAERQLISLQEASYEAEADYHRRLAELERLVGGPLPQVPSNEEVPAPAPQ